MSHAARLFNGTAIQTLHGRITPTQEQIDFLQTQWNDLVEHLKRELLSKYDYPISTWLQGSYKYATLIKPVHKGEEYDVDLGIYFEWDPKAQDIEPTPGQLREWVQRELHAYKAATPEVSEVVEPAKDRCSRVVYAKQFHIDTPTYHLDRKRDKRRLAHLTEGWEERDPKPLYQWFMSAADGEDRDQMRRLIRYLKGWAAVGFEEAPGARPSSVLLSVLVVQAYGAPMQRLGRIWERSPDDEALATVIIAIHDRILENAAVLNPVDEEENLNRIPLDQWDAFLSRMQVLRDSAETALSASDEPAAALAWSQAFSFLMPLPEAEEVEIVTQAGHAVMVLPEIRIDVYARGSKRFLTSHSNEVPGVARECDLVFTITNPHVVPDFATIEWTVRNDGKEADNLGDLGHRRAGTRLLKMDERTAYVGLHHMDCVIRCNGEVYAVRRVPVHVRDVKHLPPPTTKTPAWRRLSSAKRR